ncbi:MAG TPA: response regulator transcription factor [Gaiellaceae bacterium]|nr:response regulator transcription factor [Gaiellaceae bacterium]
MALSPPVSETSDGLPGPPRRPLSLLIADEHATFRAGVKSELETDGFEVVGEAASAAAAVAAAVRLRPDVCLVDAALPGNGLTAVSAIARRSPATTIVVLAASPDSVGLLAALERGASGYLLKSTMPGMLAKTLRAARLGEPALARAMVPALIDHVRGRPQRRLLLSGSPVPLTAREWDVAELLREGRTTLEMAERLGLSPVTVRRHVASMVRKLGATDRRTAVRVLKLGAPQSR